MSDEQPFRFAISPVVTESNARRLVDIMAQSFSSGARSEELRIRFEEITGLKRQSFYDTLAYAKYCHWVIGGGKGVPYRLNADGSWKLPQTSAGEILEKDRLAHTVSLQSQQIGKLESEVESLRDWSNGGDDNETGVAIPSLIKIITDRASTVRQRLKAAETILNYRVSDSGVVEFTKKFLRSICSSADVATDYRIEASGLLRRCESPRVAPETVRPSYRESEPAEPVEPLADLVARRRARQDAYERELALRPGEDALPSDICSTLNAKYSRHRDDH